MNLARIRGSESTLTTRASGLILAAVALGGDEQYQGAQPFVDAPFSTMALGLLPAHEHPPQQARLSQRRLRLQVEGPASDAGAAGS